MDKNTPDKEVEQPQPVTERDQIQVGNIQSSQAVAIGAGATAVYQGLSVAEVAALVIELKEVDQPKVWDGRTPYVGLAAFRESDAEFFFGRESLVDDLLGRVQQASFIVIAGPSGSGKSSVARAGLFYALRNGRLDKSDTWLLATMQPGNNPLEQLAAAVERAVGFPGKGAHIRQHGSENPLALYEQIESLLTDDRRQRCILLVDQFEEIFTQTKDEAVRLAFLNLLTAAAQAPASRVIILLAIRSDFISHCARHPALRELMSQQFQLVGAMEPHDLAKAITLPALEVGATIDPALVSRIMTDMKGEPGALPLMSFALRDLFEAEKTKKGEPIDMALKEYLDKGGVESALERHANQVFANFSEGQKELAKSIFSRLIEVGQGRVDTRRTAVFSELIPAGKNEAEVTAVIDVLAREGARLLTTSGTPDNEDGVLTQTIVTIAHEKLIEAWPWLRQLVDENREAIALQNQIANDAQAWTQTQDAGYLYRGGRLLQVEEKLAVLQSGMDTLSQRFVAASVAERQRQADAEAASRQKDEDLRTQQRVGRVFRWATAGVLLLLLVAIFFAIQANRSANSAEAAATTESQARSTAVAAQATSDVNAAAANSEALAAGEARSTAVAAQSTAQADAARANFAEATAVAAQTQTEQQRQIASLLAQSQSLVNVSRPGNQAFALARLMAVAATQIDQEAAESKNPLLAPWLYQLTRDLTAPYQPLATLTDHTNGATSVAWDSAGDRLASASDNGTVIIWDTATWQPLTTLTGHTDWVASVAWDGAGDRLASASSDNTVIIWNTATSQPLATLTDHTDLVWSVAWDDAEDRLASASGDGTVIIWNTDTWQPLATLTDHTGGVNSVAWDGTGDRLASASSDNTVIVWNTATWQPLATLTGHTNVVAGVAWDGAGDHLASTSYDGTVIIWDTATWQPLATLADQTGAVYSAAWDGAGDRLASASEDGTVVIWDTTTWQPLATLTDHTNSVANVAWDATGSRLAATYGDIIIWDTALWQPLTTLTGHTGGVTSVAWDDAGDHLASASGDGTVIIWNTAAWQPLATLTGHTDWVYSVAWDGAGDRLASASFDTTVIIWDTATWQPLTTLMGHLDQVNTVAWDDAGDRLASASNDGTVIIWDTALWQPLATLTDHTSVVFSVAWDGAGGRLASASGDGTIIIWDTTTWQPMTTLTGHTDQVYSVAWDDAGDRLASASFDTTVIIWDTATWQPLTTLTGHTGGVYGVAWDGAEDRLASASSDGTVIIWDAAAGQPLATLTDHTNWVNSVAWDDARDRLASTSYDGTVIITDLEDSEFRNCALARRNFTWAEWQQLFPDEPYRLICPQWPVHPSVPPEALSES